MRKSRNAVVAAVPMTTTALVWCASVIVGAMVGLWLDIVFGPSSLFAHVAFLGIPFLGSDLAIYGNAAFWTRRKNEQLEKRGWLTFAGYVASIALCTALRMYWLKLDLGLRLVQ